VETAGFGFATWQREPCFSPVRQSNDPLQIVCDQRLFGPAAARAANTRDEIERAPTDGLLTDSALFGSVLAAEAAGCSQIVIASSVVFCSSAEDRNECHH
jgi:hypothetical protein